MACYNWVPCYRCFRSSKEDVLLLEPCLALNDVVPCLWSDALMPSESLDTQLTRISLHNLGGRTIRHINHLTALASFIALTYLRFAGRCYFSDLEALASLTSLQTLDAKEILNDDKLRSITYLPHQPHQPEPTLWFGVNPRVNDSINRLQSPYHPQLGYHPI